MDGPTGSIIQLSGGIAVSSIAGGTGIVEIIAGAKGFFVHKLDFATITPVFFLADAQLIDLNEAPLLFGSTSNPNHTALTTMIIGNDNGASNPIAPKYLVHSNNSRSMSPGLYVSSGRRLIIEEIANTDLAVSVIIHELI